MGSRSEHKLHLNNLLSVSKTLSKGNWASLNLSTILLGLHCFLCLRFNLSKNGWSVNRILLIILWQHVCLKCFLFPIRTHGQFLKLKNYSFHVASYVSHFSRICWIGWCISPPTSTHKGCICTEVNKEYQLISLLLSAINAIYSTTNIHVVF